MLTIFGRKKKEGENKDAAGISPTQQGPIQVPEQSPIVDPGSNTAESQTPTQESRFAKIFNSVSQDYQSQRPNRPEGVTTSMSATPEYVQPRTLPPSKPMIITPHGARTSKDGEGWEEKEGQQVTSPVAAPRSQPRPSTTVPTTPAGRSPTQFGVKETAKHFQRPIEQPSIQQMQAAPANVPS